MSDWQVGDLALCQDDSPDAFGALPVVAGAVYRVAGITNAPERHDKYGTCLGLHLEDVERWHWGYSAPRFRKIRPDEHEACEPEFVKLLKRTKVPA
jgi:hypothetical protein